MSLLVPDSGLLFWMLLSFGIVFFVLAKFGFPIITKMVEERKQYIDHSLIVAKEANEQLANIKAEGESILTKANEEQVRILKEAAEARGLIVDHSDKYGWSHTSPGDSLLQFCLDNDLSDILINRNEFYGYRVTGTGTHSGTATTLPPKTSSTRKYLCPCCGNSVRATKAVNIACLDCAEQMVLAG